MALNAKFELGNVGFNGATPVAKDSAYTQTYATALRTVANNTSVDVTGTVTNTTPYGMSSAAEMTAILTAINALRVDVDAVKKPLNALIDYLQLRGDIG